MTNSFHFRYSSSDAFGNKREFEFSGSGSEDARLAALGMKAFFAQQSPLLPPEFAPPAYVSPLPKYAPPTPYITPPSVPVPPSLPIQPSVVEGCSCNGIPYRGWCQFRNGLYHYNLTLHYQGKNWSYEDKFEQFLNENQLNWFVSQVSFRS